MQPIHILLFTAVSIGFLHTVFGPDHYVPFVAMSRAGRWSLAKTIMVTVLCGFGHVASSVLVGLVGAVFGVAVSTLEIFEGARGSLAAWALISFGLVYMVWGITAAVRRRPHAHGHIHADGTVHEHAHVHEDGHAHVHAAGGTAKLTPWVLFTIFVFGPCEPLIPLLMYPAIRSNFLGAAYVTAAFGAATILTMLGIVTVLSYGAGFIRLGFLEKYSHALAGGVIAASGLAVIALGI